MIFISLISSKLLIPLIILNLSNYSWEKIETKGQSPTNRQGHLALLYGYKMYIIGGNEKDSYYNSINSLDLKTVFNYSNLY